MRWNTIVFGILMFIALVPVSGAQDISPDDRFGRDGNTLLHLAAAGNDAAMVRLQLREGAEVNTRNFNDMTPLHHAAREGHVEVAELLLNRGAHVNARNDEGATPLHFAAFGESRVSEGGVHGATVLMLLEKGARVNARTHSGRTPLTLAASRGRDNAAIIGLLVMYGGVE